jgi:site-specific DNA-methyltransferase (adenine-specific)
MSALPSLVNDITSFCEERLLVGDCLDRMRDLPDNSIDSMVTDPPSGTGFGDHDWDSFGPEEQGAATPEALAAFRSFLTQAFKEAHRAMKPGAYAVVWAFPRSCHHTMTALEDAGLYVRDVITHHYATGSPKSRCPGEWVDRSPGADVKQWSTWITTVRTDHGMTVTALAKALGGVSPEKVAGWELGCDLPTARERMRLTKLFRPDGYVTSSAQEWEGWGTALKPATEFWIVARKPLEGGDLGDNVLRWGTGAMPIQAVRTGPDGGLAEGGRWPTNLILSHAPGCEIVSQKKVPTSVTGERSREWGASGGANNWGRGKEVGRGDSGTPSMETVPLWRCQEGCPVRLIEGQAGRDGTSRYFPAFRVEPEDTIDDLIKFLPKTGAGERPVTASGLRHPTAKALPLMRWLLRAFTPPGGRVLDPFLGSGATAEAAMVEGFDWVGCEKCDGTPDPYTQEERPDYVSLVLARIERYFLDKSPGQPGFTVARPTVAGLPESETEQDALF